MPEQNALERLNVHDATKMPNGYFSATHGHVQNKCIHDKGQYKLKRHRLVAHRSLDSFQEAVPFEATH
jgi:hypothetical protein